MLGIILLLLSLIFYIKGNIKVSLLLYVSFVTSGLGFLADSIIGTKNTDLAFIYLCVVYLYNRTKRKQNPLITTPVITRTIWLLLLFLFCSVLYSYFHYKFTLFQILQGGRALLLFLSYFVVVKVSPKDVKWILEKLYYITLVHSVLYIIQVFTNLPVLPNSIGGSDGVAGIARYYNSPHFLSLFIFFVILRPNYLNVRYKSIARFILLIALICTLGRTYILLSLGCLMIGLFLDGKMSKIASGLLVVAICLLPLADSIAARFDKSGNSKGDLEEILSGEFVDNAKYGIRTSETTMSYRFSWIAERVIYLQDRPFGEKFFGLGLISDSQYNIVSKHYNFKLGNYNPQIQERTQLQTADIAYGTLLSKFGYGGSVIVIFLWCYITVFLFKRRSTHPAVYCISLELVNMIICSFSGSSIADMGNFVLPFLALAIIYYQKTYGIYE